MLRANPKTRTVPIVVVTGDGYETDLAHARSVGADLVLIKPCLPEVLLAEIRRLVARKPETRSRSGRAKAAIALKRRDTTSPPAAPPVLVCPSCHEFLIYQRSHVGRRRGTAKVQRPRRARGRASSGITSNAPPAAACFSFASAPRRCGACDIAVRPAGPRGGSAGAHRTSTTTTSSTRRSPSTCFRSPWSSGASGSWNMRATGGTGCWWPRRVGKTVTSWLRDDEQVSGESGVRHDGGVEHLLPGGSCAARNRHGAVRRAVRGAEGRGHQPDRRGNHAAEPGVDRAARALWVPSAGALSSVGRKFDRYLGRRLVRTPAPTSLAESIPRSD